MRVSPYSGGAQLSIRDVYPNLGSALNALETTLPEQSELELYNPAPVTANVETDGVVVQSKRSDLLPILLLIGGAVAVIYFVGKAG
jgi:hypothetical protein